MEDIKPKNLKQLVDSGDIVDIYDFLDTIRTIIGDRKIRRIYEGVKHLCSDEEKLEIEFYFKEKRI